MLKSLLFILLILQSYSLVAVLPPQILKKSAISSSEIIKIKVKNVELKSKTEYVTIIKVKAKVLEVKRSKSDLKKGDLIIIEYGRRKLKKGMVGPKSNPILYKNQITAAFLYKNIKKNTYHIGARSNSFNNHLYKSIKKNGDTLKKVNKKKQKIKKIENKLKDGYTIDEKKFKIFKGKLGKGKGGMPILISDSEYIIINPRFVRGKNLKWKEKYEKMYEKNIVLKGKLRIRHCGVMEQCLNTGVIKSLFDIQYLKLETKEKIMFITFFKSTLKSIGSTLKNIYFNKR